MDLICTESRAVLGPTSTHNLYQQWFYSTDSETCSVCPLFWSTTHCRRRSCWSGVHWHSASLLEWRAVSVLHC